MGKTELYQVISRSLNSKERTAKVYAASIRRVHREVYKTELEDLFMKFIEKAKTFSESYPSQERSNCYAYRS